MCSCCPPARPQLPRVLSMETTIKGDCLCLKSREETNTREKQVNPLGVEEIQDAEEYWTKQAQSSLFERMEKADFKTLSPFFDGKGIIRVSGHVNPDLLSYEGYHPALLPHDHWIFPLIIRNVHRIRPPGVTATTAKTRRNYWIIKGTNIAKLVKQRCTFCKEIEARVESQFMANLPSCRQQPYTPPFLYTACDYFGPMKVKVGRNKNRQALWRNFHLPQHKSHSL